MIFYGGIKKKWSEHNLSKSKNNGFLHVTLNTIDPKKWRTSLSCGETAIKKAFSISAANATSNHLNLSITSIIFCKNFGPVYKQLLQLLLTDASYTS